MLVGRAEVNRSRWLGLRYEEKLTVGSSGAGDRKISRLSSESGSEGGETKRLYASVCERIVSGDGIGWGVTQSERKKHLVRMLRSTKGLRPMPCPTDPCWNGYYRAAPYA